MEICTLFPGGFAANTYLVRRGKDAVLIDCTAPVTELRAALGDATLHAILLTHGHFDHLLTLDAVSKQTGAPVYLHEGDAELPLDGTKNAHAVFFGRDAVYQAPDRSLAHGEHLTFGALTLDVISTPGHTRGSVLYRTDDALFTGDTVFAAGYGRTDLYGGDPAALLASLRSLESLPQALRIYPGHGESATLGEALDRLF